jgi:hypothetical protein
MERRANAILRYLVDLRSILLAFCIFDVIVVWIMSSEISLTCTVRPWYWPWSYLIGPTILLVSSLFLSMNRWWGNTVALLASGCFIGYFVHLLLLDHLLATQRYDWILFWIDHPYLVGSQYLFALIVSCYSALSLKRNFQTRKLTEVPEQEPQR